MIEREEVVKAVDLLNKSKLAKFNITPEGYKLDKELFVTFLEACESVDVENEGKLPDIVSDVYNKLVDEDLSVLPDKVGSVEVKEPAKKEIEDKIMEEKPKKENKPKVVKLNTKKTVKEKGKRTCNARIYLNDKFKDKSFLDKKASDILEVLKKEFPNDTIPIKTVHTCKWMFKKIGSC